MFRKTSVPRFSSNGKILYSQSMLERGSSGGKKSRGVHTLLKSRFLLFVPCFVLENVMENIVFEDNRINIPVHFSEYGELAIKSYSFNSSQNEK